MDTFEAILSRRSIRQLTSENVNAEMQKELLRAAAPENILLTAHSFGLGGVWLAIYPWKKRINDLNDLLNLPDDVIPISLVAIGHPNISKGFDDRYKPAKIHYNQW